MTAKIKSHPKHDSRQRAHVPMPKGVSGKAFEKVYWPFLPVLVCVCLLLALAVQSVPLHHLTGRVLGYQTSEDAQELLKDTNLQRQKAGDNPLHLNDSLNEAAQAKANDMARRDYWSHYTPQGVAPWSFVTATGYTYRSLGENLAAGFGDDDAVLNAWMASTEHRANILNYNYTEVGFGYANIANYKAAGGGPMTLVVAFYAQPTATFAIASHPSSSTQPPSATLASSTTARAVAVLTPGLLSRWTPTILLAVAFAAGAVFIERHRRYFKTAIVRSERYVLRHPATDVGLLIIVGLVFLLAQTAGYIQ